MCCIMVLVARWFWKKDLGVQRRLWPFEMYIYCYGKANMYTFKYFESNILDFQKEKEI